LRGSWRFGSVIAHTSDLIEEFGEYQQGQCRTFWRQDEGFFGQGDHGMFELGFGSRRMVGIGHPDHQEPSDDGHDQNGEQLLTNTVFGLAMEGLDVEGGFLVAVMGFHRPASKIERDDGGSRKASTIMQVGEEHRELAIGTCHTNGM